MPELCTIMLIPDYQVIQCKQYITQVSLNQETVSVVSIQLEIQAFILYIQARHMQPIPVITKEKDQSQHPTILLLLIRKRLYVFHQSSEPQNLSYNLLIRLNLACKLCVQFHELCSTHAVQTSKMVVSNHICLFYLSILVYYYVSPKHIPWHIENVFVFQEPKIQILNE